MLVALVLDLSLCTPAHHLVGASTREAEELGEVEDFPAWEANAVRAWDLHAAWGSSGEDPMPPSPPVGPEQQAEYLHAALFRFAPRGTRWLHAARTALHGGLAAPAPGAQAAEVGGSHVGMAWRAACDMLRYAVHTHTPSHVRARCVRCQVALPAASAVLSALLARSSSGQARSGGSDGSGRRHGGGGPAEGVVLSASDALLAGDALQDAQVRGFCVGARAHRASATLPSREGQQNVV
jgi:hypothetical protein